MAGICYISVINFIKNDAASEVLNLFDAIYRSEYENVFNEELQPRKGIQGFAFKYHHARHLTQRSYRSLSKNSQAIILLTDNATHNEGLEIMRSIKKFRICNMSVLIHKLLDSSPSNVNGCSVSDPGSKLLFQIGRHRKSTASSHLYPSNERQHSNATLPFGWICTDRQPTISTQQRHDNSSDVRRRLLSCQYLNVYVNMKASAVNMIQRLETLSKETNKTFQKMRSKPVDHSSKLIPYIFGNLTWQQDTDVQNETEQQKGNKVHHLNNNSDVNASRRRGITPTWDQLQSFDAVMQKIEEEDRIRSVNSMRRQCSSMTVGIHSCLEKMLKHIRVDTADTADTPADSSRHMSLPTVLKIRKKRRFNFPFSRRGTS